MSIASPFWAPDRHADRRPRLLARARTTSALRAWFEAEGFVEVEPAALQVSPGNETHLHGFATELIGEDGARTRAFLHTSPEFAMKKLLAAGETRIFALCHVFRNRERTALHAPEFTMLEWYRARAGHDALMDDCAMIMRLAAQAAGTDRLRFRGRECDPFAPPERLSVREAFLRYAGVDIFDPPAPSWPGSSRPSTPGRQAVDTAVEERRFSDPGSGGCHDDVDARDEPGHDRSRTPTGTSPGMTEAGLCPPAVLVQACARFGMRTAPDDSWSDLFSRLLSEKIEPNLGLGRPTILVDYPASEAALARLSPHDSRVAERFELYACGVELANAFGELTDANEQRRRFKEDMALKAQLYGESYPLDEDFLAALPYMGAASGAALGLDRVVMLACGAERIEDVQWTPVFRP